MELPACPVETTLMLIGDKWKVLILRDLMDGTKRFGELKKSIGTVSQKVLTAQLRDMEEKGLLTRKVYACLLYTSANDPLIGSSCPQATRLRALPHRGTG